MWDTSKQTRFAPKGSWWDHNVKAMTSQIRFFWARSMIFTVCGPQVCSLLDTLIYCKRQKCPTFLKNLGAMLITYGWVKIIFDFSYCCSAPAVSLAAILPRLHEFSCCYSPFCWILLKFAQFWGPQNKILLGKNFTIGGIKSCKNIGKNLIQT